MALIFHSVVDYIFDFSPVSPPAGPTVQPWVTAFISPLRTTLLVSNRLDLYIQIDGIDLSFCRRLYFRLFTCITPAGPTVLPRVTAFICPLRTTLLVCKYPICFVK